MFRRKRKSTLWGVLQKTRIQDRMKTNLWNLGDGKTRQTIEYIGGLKYPKEWKPHQKSKFNQIQTHALQHGLSANQMLHRIGFNPMGMDGIYRWAKKTG